MYFAKFLTSPKLINLQLRDVYFRRHVLVQVTSPSPLLPSPAPVRDLLRPSAPVIPPTPARAQILMFLQTAAAAEKLVAAQRTKLEEMEAI